jgi:hypothetical protein
MSIDQQSRGTKRKSFISCSEISSSRQLFLEKFPGIVVPKDKAFDLVPNQWNFEGSEEIIFQWLPGISIGLFSFIKNEHSI